MNEWSQQKTRKGMQIYTSADDILLFRPNSRFIIQYLLLSISLSLPLAVLVASSGRGWDFFLWLVSPLISYGLGWWFLPSGIGFFSPLILALIYGNQFNLFAKIIQIFLINPPPIQQLQTGIGISTVCLWITSLITWQLIEKNSLFSARHTFWIGSGLSILVGSWIASNNWSIVLLLSIETSIFSFIIRTKVDSRNKVAHIIGLCVAGLMALVVAISMASTAWNALVFILFLIAVWATYWMTHIIVFYVANIMAGGVKGSVGFFVVSSILFFIAFFVMGVAILPLPWFLISCTLVSVGAASLEWRWLGISIAAIFVALGWGNLNFQSLWAVPFSLVGYYRILPDYLFSSLVSLVFTQPLQRLLSLKPDSFLTKLPPFTTELLWLPLPNHSRILAATFRQNTALGFTTLQKMKTSSLPGFKLTIQKALPSIVADGFAAVNTILELISSGTPDDLQSLLRYSYFPPYWSSLTFNSGNAEIDLIVPILKQIARDTETIFKSDSSTLQERGLERLVDKLKMLPTQLPGLGLKPQAVKRWQPAIERWQHILELEIAEQHKTSQGELPNPFYWGNPLRPDRADIFKGRQDFADRLVRLILDRNRPTLVLHGPRRAGKTSFLLNLPRLLPSDLVPIYLDMQQGSMTASEGDFCYGLVRAIDRDTRSQGLQLPPIPSRQAFAIQPYPTLEDWFNLALPKLGERRLLLNLDEFEKIGSAIKDNRISERLFDQLRSMIQHYDRLGFLFSGVQTLEELGPRWSNYFISVVPMEMHYLEPHEAEDLLLHPDPEFTLRYDTGIVAEILRLTRCQPYLLQLIGSALVNQANSQHTQLATTTLLQASIQPAFTNGEPYFTNIWTEFTGTTPAEVTAGQQILIALAQGNSPVETNDETTTAARRRLLRYHVIERDGDIDAIEIPLFKQWVRERAIET